MIEVGDSVIIQTGTRKNETGKVAYVRMGPPSFSKVIACSVLCLDGRAVIYPVENLKKK